MICEGDHIKINFEDTEVGPYPEATYHSEACVVPLLVDILQTVVDLQEQVKRLSDRIR